MGLKQSETAEQVIRTTCSSHCGGSCQLKVHLRDGVITRIETDDGEEPQIRACLKGRAQRQKVYAPDRLLYPLKRVGARGEGKCERISWDEALATVAQALRAVIDRDGPAALVYDSMPGDIAFLHGGRWLAQLLGKFGAYTRLWGGASFMGGNAASLVTYGTLQASNNRDDLLNSQLIILWGFDPAVSVCGTNTSWYMLQAKEKGTRFISLDPRYTDSAALLDAQWIPVRPGTDTALAVAMAYVLIQENLSDRKFIDTYTIGFDKYRDYVLGVEDGIAKTPAWAEAITGVPAAVIEELARAYGTAKPAALMPSGAPGRTSYGEQLHRATATLAAMTGNVGIPGGYPAVRAWESVVGGYPYAMKFFQDRVDQHEKRDAPTGKDVVERRKAQIHRLELPDMILKGKAGGYPADGKLLFLASCNYLNQAADINKIARAFRALEFMVVVEQFMTPTAKFADIILPAASFLERQDITVGWHSPYIGLMPKVIEAPGETKTQLQIARELAKHMGIRDFAPKEEEEMLGEMVAECSIDDLARFREEGCYKMKLAEPYVAFRAHIEDPRNHPFPTPSGKIEIYSERWAELNNPELPPIPKYLAAKETWFAPLAKKYPLQYISTHFGRRALSQFANVPWMRELGGQELQINPLDAAARGIESGELVRVFNDRGQLLVRAQVTGRIMPGVVSLPHGAWYNPDETGLDRGASANVLTHGEFSPAGAWALNTNLVEVARYGEPS